ncbi:efflux transporter outer membrane subunit [Altericroceibacterium endophyticum]|uniref:Efflux transporter outer membrane subunit n=1 Tax=Altericroceibacterium endophyticum TaxID=1808508 RepID=A0A6I4T7T6_9SPHN|nr:efflux transporter outer membrane subunit [Altericroceibacterium endophyticum]MXO66322.1 efflux transporter outer membrane subunit [Altericroceibacterium endophyticum]
MTRKFLSTAAMALALSGCINMAPDHERPALTTSPAYDPDYRPDGMTIASRLGWRDFVTDPRLEELIATAIRNNRDLVAATARIEQARAQYRIDDSRRLPNVVADASATRSRTPLTGIAGAAAGGENAPSSITQNQFQVGVGVSSFELDFWGRVANLSDASRAQYLASVANQRAFYLSLIADVSSTYFQLIEAEEQIALADATAKSRQDGLEIAKLRLDAGVTSALPYRQAESLLTQARQQLASQQLGAAQLRNQLSVLVGGRIPDQLPQRMTLAAQDNGIRLDPGLPSDLMLLRPDIIAAEEQLRSARANIGAARAAFFPSISLTGNSGFVSNELDNLFTDGGLSWSFGPSINLPIFDWGQREANLDLAKAREVEQVANYDLTVQNAFREVSDALAGRRWLAQQVDTLIAGVAAQQKIADIARLRYREGVADYLEVLDAERNLFTAQQNLLTTRRAYLQNQTTLFIALGGGLQSAQEDLVSPAED